MPSSYLPLEEPNVPNLDCMTRDELRDFWAKYCRGTPRKDAAKLLGFTEAQAKPKGYTNAVASLAAYAINKSAAISCRERGDIQAALAYETICDRIYEALPEYARW
jgi:hypothetical protein